MLGFFKILYRPRNSKKTKKHMFSKKHIKKKKGGKFQKEENKALKHVEGPHQSAT